MKFSLYKTPSTHVFLIAVISESFLKMKHTSTIRNEQDFYSIGNRCHHHSALFWEDCHNPAPKGLHLAQQRASRGLLPGLGDLKF